MTKDLDYTPPNAPEGFEIPSEESLEQILASIRKIMDPSTDLSQQKKIAHTDPHSKEAESSAPLVLTNKKNAEDVLVLKKKSDPLELVQRKSVSHEKQPLPSTPHQPLVAPQKGTLETLVSASLSSLVQAWLEKNLPNIVEKVVKEEIQKLLDPRQKNR